MSSNSNINKGKVLRAVALVLDFTLEELELLINKLIEEKKRRQGNKNVNRDTTSL